MYSVRAVGAEIPSLDFNQVLREALKLAPKLRLRTLDLHVAACEVAGARKMATFDKDIRAKAKVLKELGIGVVP